MRKLVNPDFDKHGYIQIYTGDGKGKTTASFGLVCRALGRNWNVLVMQFFKDRNQTGEYKYLSRHVEHLHYVSCGLPHFPTKTNIDEKDKLAFVKGWNFVVKNHKKYDMIVMDELNIAVDFGFIEISKILDFLKTKPKSLEIVITGRNARPEIIEVANLVTEMKPIKHYWDAGIPAREGIEY